MTGTLLGYLINNFLIDSKQYEAWRGLALDELRDELDRAGIMSSAEYDEFSQQLENCSELAQVQSEEHEHD